MPCKYWDSGWCYAPDDAETTDKNGQCNDMANCPQAIPMDTFIGTAGKVLQFRDSGDDSEEHY